ncbi:MAG: thioredoxin fold domain-containing protein [Agrobacterium albertimagni]
MGFPRLIAAVVFALGAWLVANTHAALSQSSPLDAVQVGLQTGKPTVVEFGSTRCKGCRDMKRVLTDLTRMYGERVSVVDIDLFSPQGRGLISRYRVQMMPMQVFYDAAGHETGRHLGPIDLPEILASLGINTSEKSTAPR